MPDLDLIEDGDGEEDSDVLDADSAKKSIRRFDAMLELLCRPELNDSARVAKGRHDPTSILYGL